MYPHKIRRSRHLASSSLVTVAAGLRTFADMFAREDGAALGNRYSEDTFTLSGYQAANDPAEVGAELLTNPGMEGSYVGGVAPDWSAFGSGTPAEETTIVHGDSSSQKLTRAATNDRVVAAASTTAGKWYKATAWIYRTAGNAFFFGGPSSSTVSLFTAKSTVTDEWEEITATFRATGNTSWVGLWLTSAGSVGYIDDVSVIEIDFDDTLALFSPHATKFSVHATQTNEDAEQIGLALRANADNSDCILVWVEKVASKVFVAKRVGGTWSAESNDTVAVGAANVLRVDQNGTEIKVYYDGDLLQTLDITEISALPSDQVGLFNAGANGVHTSFAVTRYAEAPRLTLFVEADGDDSNPGSAALPKLTNAGANTKADVINSISHIRVGIGTFDTITVPRDGLNYSGAGETTVIDGGGAANCIYSDVNDDVTVRDFKCYDGVSGVHIESAENALVSGVVADLMTTYGVAFRSCTGVLSATDCEASNVDQTGFDSSASVGVAFTRCYFHTPGDAGAYGYESEAAADDNVYTDCWSVGACTSGFISKLSDNSQYVGCVATGADYGWFSKGASNMSLNYCAAYANEVGIGAFDNAGGAPDSSGLTVHNTIIHDNTVAGIEVDTDSETDADLDFNCYQGNTLAGKWTGSDYATLALLQAASSLDASSVTTDPAFDDTTYPDGFRLAAGSSLLTAGESGGPIGLDGA